MASGPGDTFDAALSGGLPAEPSLATGRPARRIDGDLRTLAARGIVINAAFLVALNLLGFLRGFGVAAFLTPAEYGLWGLLAVSFVTLLRLIQVGVDDKFIQQDEEDQERAFQEAFTLQAMLCAVFVVVILAAMPAYALIYDDWSIVAPGYVLALAIPPGALQAPLWTYYRDMDFLTQRKLQAFDPVVSFAVTLGLAAAGAGYWSLVVGVVAGAWVAGLVAARASPHALRLRFRREGLSEYWGFSGPLFYAALIMIVLAQVPVIVAKHTIGLVGVGAMTISTTISQYASRVDEIVTDTLYPAVCAVKDRHDLLLESFLKSNRLALLWAVPVGGGIALFAPDIVRHVLGEKWALATYAIQAIGVSAAINQIGFNWTAFNRALGDTKPIARSAAVMCVAVLLIAIPLLITEGIDGYVTGMGISVLILVASRLYYVRKLFPLGVVLANCVRGMTPAVPGLLAVIAIRLALWGGERTTLQFALEMAVFVITVAMVTLWAERALLREFRGYLRGTGAGIRSSLGS